MTLTVDTFTYVADLVRRSCAIQLEPGKEYLVESRLLPLARDAHHPSVDAYIRGVRGLPHAAEHDRIVEALTTNETSWFRDVTPFRALTDHVVPQLRVDRGRPWTVRVWSAACSTGQEPYSIAMTLLDCSPALPFQITATDVSEEVLARGRAGLYSQLEVNRGLPAGKLVQHFSRVGTQWQVSRSLRSMVTFSRHNLMHAPPAGGPYDVVFLRNVLIYFDPVTKREVLHRVRAAVRPGGYLVLGAAETTIGLDDGWERLPVARSSVYRLNAGRTA